MYKISKLVLSSSLCLSLLPISDTAHAESKADIPLKHDFKQPVHSQSEAHEVLKELPSDIKKNYEDYEVVKAEKDKLGFTHYTLQPVVDGAFATDKEVKVHVNKDNKVVLVNGEVEAKKVKPTNEVEISKDKAIDRAFQSVDVKSSEAKNIDDHVVKENKVEIDGEKN